MKPGTGAKARIVKRAFPVDPAAILPAVTPDTQPYWEALKRGTLLVQSCVACGRARHPVAPVCPYCRGTGWTWQDTAGEGTVFSFVRFHRSYLPEFEDLMPYVVATVALKEGPRMFGRLVGKNAQPRIGQPVRLVIEEWPDGRCVPAFELVEVGG